MTDTFQCDCCNEIVPADEIRTVVAYGIETSACARCRGDDDALIPDDSEPLTTFKLACGHVADGRTWLLK